MFNSSSINSTFPIFYEDNNVSLSDLNDEINPFSYYDQLLSPMVYYDIENYSHLLTNHDLTMPQDPFQATNINSTIPTDDSSIGLEVPTNKMGDSSKGDDVSNVGMVVRPKKRRTSNKDRHSKIRTANGLRDRRMRLSLEVARPFFNLQDMLGFDKGSMTVEWLLTRSKEAIDEVIQSKNNGSTSSTTKCTTISSISDCDEGESIIVEQKKATNNRKEKKDVGNVGKFAKNNKEKRLRTTKEAMKNARDKARKRTLEKNSHQLAFKPSEIEGTYDSCSMNNTSAIWSPFSNFNHQQNAEIYQSDMSRGTLME